MFTYLHQRDSVIADLLKNIKGSENTKHYVNAKFCYFGLIFLCPQLAHLPLLSPAKQIHHLFQNASNTPLAPLSVISVGPESKMQIQDLDPSNIYYVKFLPKLTLIKNNQIYSQLSFQELYRSDNYGLQTRNNLACF